jgi:hypothetical protein
MARVKASANWFYWIAGLSAFRAVMIHMSGSVSISFYSLGLTNLISVTNIGFYSALAICLVWVGFGIIAGKGQRWMFITGIVCYALDAVILLLLGIFGGAGGAGVFAYAGVAFHGYIIYQLFRGFQAAGELNAMRAAAGQNSAWYAGQPAVQQGAWPPPPGVAQNAFPPPQSGYQQPGYPPQGSQPSYPQPQSGYQQPGYPPPGGQPGYPPQGYQPAQPGAIAQPPANPYSQTPQQPDPYAQPGDNPSPRTSLSGDPIE